MSKLISIIAVALMFLFVLGVSALYAQKKEKKGKWSITITLPENNDASVDRDAEGRIKVCMEAKEVENKPARDGNEHKKGHFNILIDRPLPKNFKKQLPRRKNVHMVLSGKQCKKIKVKPGPHTIRALFTKANRVPYNPPLTATVTVTVAH